MRKRVRKLKAQKTLSLRWTRKSRRELRSIHKKTKRKEREQGSYDQRSRVLCYPTNYDTTKCTKLKKNGYGVYSLREGRHGAKFLNELYHKIDYVKKLISWRLATPGMISLGESCISILFAFFQTDRKQKKGRLNEYQRFLIDLRKSFREWVRQVGVIYMTPYESYCMLADIYGWAPFEGYLLVARYYRRNKAGLAP